MGEKLVREHLEEKLERLHKLESLILCLMRSVDTAPAGNMQRAADVVTALVDELCTGVEPLDAPQIPAGE